MYVALIECYRAVGRISFLLLYLCWCSQGIKMVPECSNVLVDGDNQTSSSEGMWFAVLCCAVLCADVVIFGAVLVAKCHLWCKAIENGARAAPEKRRGLHNLQSLTLCSWCVEAIEVRDNAEAAPGILLWCFCPKVRLWLPAGETDSEKKCSSYLPLTPTFNARYLKRL